MEAYLFYFSGAIMLLGAVAVVASRSAVGAASWLILSFLGAAGLFAALHAPFLAVLQVLVYAGAIVVLFLFVIMMLEGPVLPAEAGRLRFWMPLFALIPAAVIAVAVVLWLQAIPLSGFTAELPEGFGQPPRVSKLLLSDYVLAFELIALLLLIAMIGALALARSWGRQPWK